MTHPELSPHGVGGLGHRVFPAVSAALVVLMVFTVLGGIACGWSR